MSKKNQFFNAEITFYAFRYALGRSSYAPSSVQEYILDNIKEFSKHDLEKMCKEIDECYDLGMNMDVISWQNFKSKIKNYIE